MLTGGRASQLVDLLALRPNGGCVVGNRIAATCREAACPGTWLYSVDDGAYWQLVTNMFTHVEVWHIGFNMLALWVLGPQLELALGRARFLALYLLSGAGRLDPGLLGVAGVPGHPRRLRRDLRADGCPARGRPARSAATCAACSCWIAINVVITFLWAGISWQGHLGGFVGGVVIAGILVYAPRKRRTLWQVLGLAAYSALLVVAIVLRTLQLA